MKILVQEIKKIWNPKIILVITVIFILFYFLFFKILLDFPNGHSDTETYQYTVQWVQKYKAHLDSQEFKEVEKQLEALHLEMDEQIQKIPFLTDRGIDRYHSYQEWKKTAPKEISAEEIEKTEFLRSKDSNFIVFRVQALESLVAYYQNGYPLSDTAPSLEKEIRMKALNQEKMQSIMSESMLKNTADYFNKLIFLILIGLCILLSHLQIKDKLSKVNHLHYATKIGRKIEGIQFLASIISAIMFTSIVLIIFLGIYSRLGTQIFWNNNTTSFLTGTWYRFDFTYGSYILSNIAMMYLFSLGVSCIIFLLAKFSQNYLSFLLKLLPIFLLLNQLRSLIWNDSFSFKNSLYQTIKLSNIEIMSCFILGVLGFILVYYCEKNTKFKFL